MIGSFLPDRGRHLPSIQGLRPGYVLFPTGIDWRKNIDRTLEAYAALDRAVRDRHQLVLACRLDPWVEEDLRQRARAMGLERDHLILPGYLSDAGTCRTESARHPFHLPVVVRGIRTSGARSHAVRRAGALCRFLEPQRGAAL